MDQALKSTFLLVQEVACRKTKPFSDKFHPICSDWFLNSQRQYKTSCSIPPHSSHRNCSWKKGWKKGGKKSWKTEKKRGKKAPCADGISCSSPEGHKRCRYSVCGQHWPPCWEHQAVTLPAWSCQVLHRAQGKPESAHWHIRRGPADRSGCGVCAGARILPQHARAWLWIQGFLVSRESRSVAYLAADAPAPQRTWHEWVASDLPQHSCLSFASLSSSLVLVQN